MDTTQLGEVTAELMEKLADTEPDAELGVVMVLAEIRGEDDGEEWTGIEWRCSDSRAWIQYGMLHAALESEREVT